jgi:hypothetical protein
MIISLMPVPNYFGIGAQPSAFADRIAPDQNREVDHTSSHMWVNDGRRMIAVHWVLYTDEDPWLVQATFWLIQLSY